MSTTEPRIRELADTKDVVWTFTVAGALTTGVKAGVTSQIVVPFNVNILGLVAYANTAPTGSPLIVDVQKVPVSGAATVAQLFGSRTVTDAATTVNSQTLTSATGAFGQGDIGATLINAAGNINATTFVGAILGLPSSTSSATPVTSQTTATVVGGSGTGGGAAATAAAQTVIISRQAVVGATLKSSVVTYSYTPPTPAGGGSIGGGAPVASTIGVYTAGPAAAAGAGQLAQPHCLLGDLLQVNVVQVGSTVAGSDLTLVMHVERV